VGNLTSLSPYDIPCPNATPVFYNGQCVNPQCPTEFPLLNVTKVSCLACPNGTSWNTTNSSCSISGPSKWAKQNSRHANSRLSQFHAPNPLHSSTMEPALIALTQLQSSTQVVNNAQSVRGILQLNRLHHYYYNGTDPNYNNSTIDPNLTTSPNTVYCPSDTPYFNGSDCIDCNGSTPYFNQTSQECTQC
jgi:hypothetical protein